MFKKNSRKKIYVIHKQELTKDNIFIIAFNNAVLILNAQKKDQKEIYRITVDFFLLSFTKNTADTLRAGCAEKRVAGRYKRSSFSGDWKT